MEESKIRTLIHEYILPTRTELIQLQKIIAQQNETINNLLLNNHAITERIEMLELTIKEEINAQDTK